MSLVVEARSQESAAGVITRGNSADDADRPPRPAGQGEHSIEGSLFFSAWESLTERPADGISRPRRVLCAFVAHGGRSVLVEPRQEVFTRSR